MLFTLQKPSQGQTKYNGKTVTIPSYYVFRVVIVCIVQSYERQII